ncbi:hypothetical protein [Ancylomarina longa]|uniref:Uncharacterized protein n=1 Tax=Ancylomarina longa TaxID=2487017 RepID=A0A434AZS5_9BACT|nr:hypothetical protein [Ancylomarina longa]RUT79957.1 hypothetical protein DLK05_00975 [Ancylomarina longa]
MPNLILPKSDTKRLEVLGKSIETGKKDATQEKHFIPEELLTNAEEIKNRFQASYELVNSKLSARQKEVREKNESIDVLRTFVRDFFEVLKRRTYRMSQPAEVLRFFNITLSGDLPDIRKDADLIKAAENIILGDGEAVKAGYKAMQNPSAAEIQRHLDNAKREIGDVAPADREFNQVQQALTDMRDEVDDMIHEIADYIQFSLRKQEASKQRRFMRTYGFEYRYLKNEPQDEELVVSGSSDNQ